jgi:taurine dioxygenase
MKAIPLTDHFGVELRDVSASQPLDSDDLNVLRDAFDQGVVLVRGQEFSDEDHDRFVQALGELHTFPWGTTVEYMSNVIPDNPSIAGTRRLLFHTDGVYGKKVAPGTCLYAQEVSPTSPPTAFANSVRAYDNLGADIKAEIAGLHAYNTFDITQAEKDADPTRYRLAEHPDGASLPHIKTAVHPVVISVPHTGQKALFVNEFNTSHIVEYGPDSAAGEELLQTLFRALYEETNIYTHHYVDHDLVIWNNLATQHARTARIDRNPRTFRRLVLSSLNW